MCRYRKTYIVAFIVLSPEASSNVLKCCKTLKRSWVGQYSPISMPYISGLGSTSSKQRTIGKTSPSVCVSPFLRPAPPASAAVDDLYWTTSVAQTSPLLPGSPGSVKEKYDLVQALPEVTSLKLTDQVRQTSLRVFLRLWLPR